MHKNILITGSHGFIGMHLKNELQQNNDIDIFDHIRSGSFENLEKINFIYYLEGEVNPKFDRNITMHYKFKNNVNNINYYSNIENEFKKKLFVTFQDYHRTVQIKE